MHESLLPTSADADGILHLPAATEEARDAVMNELMRMFDALPEISVMVPNREAHLVDVENVPHHGDAFALIVPLLEMCLDRGPDDLSPALVAQFAFIAMLPALPSAIALQTAFGRSVGLESLRDFARLISRAERRGQSVDDYVAELVEADAVPRGKLVRLFHGETRRIPDVARIARGVALLRRVASLAPPFLRPPLLCTIAWLHWAQGKRALAMAYLREASRIEPADVLVYGLTWLVSTKTPVWLER